MDTLSLAGRPSGLDPFDSLPLPALMVEPLVRAALLEDLGRAGDITTDAIVPAAARAETALVARQPGTLAGLPVAVLAFKLIDPSIEISVEASS